MRAQKGLSRRAFGRSAVAIGGVAALSACLDRRSDDDIEQGPADLSTLPDRQHAWNDYLDTDEYDNHVMAEHHVLLQFEYVGSDHDTERDNIETAFETLERAYVRGNNGLLFTVGYSPTYFERFDEPLHESVALPAPEALAPFENPIPDSADVLVHLASDHPDVVLAAEEALTGDLDEINDIDVEGTLTDVFVLDERRTGFVGDGIPAAKQSEAATVPDSEPVPEDAPLFMGFKSGFRANQASEDRVTVPDGPFAGGTTTHLSRIALNLHQWYEQDTRRQRVQHMFCPAHAADERVEGAGHNLGSNPDVDGCAEDLEADARMGVVGHNQKLVRAREDGESLLLRRDFNSTDNSEAGLHFLAHQQRIADFVAVREAMNGTDLADSGAIGARVNNGILQYLSVRNRANYLVPPRSHRSLPEPNPAH